VLRGLELLRQPQIDAPATGQTHDRKQADCKWAIANCQSPMADGRFLRIISFDFFRHCSLEPKTCNSTFSLKQDGRFFTTRCKTASGLIHPSSFILPIPNP
jgi:hypothetical protein